MLYSMRPDDIRYTDIEKLISESYPEGIHLDYKKTYAFLDGNGNKEESRVKFAADVAAFANADGGCLVIGVTDNSGAPGSIVGDESALNDVDVASQLTKIINDNIDPKVSPNVRILCLHSEDNTTRAIVVRVEPSTRAPHQVFRTGTFPIRRGSDTKNMTVREISESLIAAEGWAEYVERIRAARIPLCMYKLARAGEIDIASGLLVIHLIHFDVRRRFRAFDLQTLKRATFAMPSSVLGNLPTETRFVPDGYLALMRKTSALQFHRNGATELVVGGEQFVNILENSTRHLNLDIIEDTILRMAESIAPLCASAGARYPFYLSASLLNLQDSRPSTQTPPKMIDVRGSIVPIDDQRVDLQGVVIESTEDDVKSVVKPLLDNLWHCVGVQGSLSYDAEGRWNR